MVDKRNAYTFYIVTMLAFMLAACANSEPVPTVTLPSVATVVKQQPRRVSDISQSATPAVSMLATQLMTEISDSTSPDAIVRRVDTPLFALPGEGSNVIQVLAEGSQLIVIGRMEGDQWLQVVAPNSALGWVNKLYLDVFVDMETVSLTASIGEVEPTPLPAQMGNSPIITGVTQRSKAIFERGQQLGNRANVFSKVGDSLTVASYVLYPIGWGTYNLRDFSYLEPVVSYFSSENARIANSFANTSLAADNGWTTQSVLDPVLAHPDVCNAGETPLACEYRTTKPAVALILLGTNDVLELQSGAYRENLSRIISMTIEHGTIPVVSTLPDRLGYENQVVRFNAIIRDLAREYEIPLWDYGWAMRQLPNNGLSDDGAHPSWPPGDVSTAVDFNSWNLQYGYTVRNLTALQALDVLWQRIIRS